MIPQGSELVIKLYNNLESRFRQFLQYVPYDEHNKKAVLPLLSSIILETGSLIDTIFREELKKSRKKKENLNINDFSPYFETNFNFSGKKTLFYNYPLSYIQPFAKWYDKKKDKYSRVDWWFNYNQIKHNRIKHSNLSTLETAIEALCSLHQIISQLPTFLDAIFRHDIVYYGNWSEKYIKDELSRSNPTRTALVETELFATTLGQEDFPENLKDLTRHHYSFSSPKFLRFIGGNY